MRDWELCFSDGGYRITARALDEERTEVAVRGPR